MTRVEPSLEAVLSNMVRDVKAFVYARNRKLILQADPRQTSNIP